MIGAYAVAWAAAAEPAGFDFTRGAGSFESGGGDTVWVVLPDSSVVPGDSLTLIESPEPSPQQTYASDPARLHRAVAVARDRNHIRSIIGENMEVSGYRLRLAGESPSQDWFSWGFAIRAPFRAFRMSKGHVESDLDHDGLVERYTQCASFEGVHLNIWEGAPFQGTELTDIYFPAGYDTEPTCPGLDSLKAAWYGEDSTTTAHPSK